MVAIRHIVANDYDLSDLDDSINLNSMTTTAWFDSRPNLRDAIVERVTQRHYPKKPVWRYLVTKHDYPYGRTSFDRYIDKVVTGA